MTVELVTGMDDYNFRATFLPYPNFRESARSLNRDALMVSLRTLHVIDDLDKEYVGTLDTGIRQWRYMGAGSALNWWALWKEFPVARAAYGYEVAMALRQANWKPWNPSSDDWVVKYEEQLGSDFKYTPAISRKWEKQIEWLGNPRLHSCHRKYLLYYRNSWYRQYGWKEPPIKHRGEPDEYTKRATISYKLWFPDDVVRCAGRAHQEMLIRDGAAAAE